MIRLTILATLVAGCTSSSSEQAELLDARDRWNELGLGFYSFVWNHSCECIDAGRDIDVEVVDNRIVSARYSNDQTQVPEQNLGGIQTVEEVFATIEDAIADGAFQLRVEYDAALSYPTLVSVDYDKQTADDEFIVRIENLSAE
jgi:hypothetical protein